MERRKGWKDFWALVTARPDYRAWMYCKNPEEQALRTQYLDLMNKLSTYHAAIQKVPMPEEPNDIHLSRSALHIDQNIAFHSFMETLLENCLRQSSDENLNLLFAFLETYVDLLQQEAKWCKK